MKLDMYLVSDDKTVASELNYLLMTDGERWFYCLGQPSVGDIVIDGSDAEDGEQITNEDIAVRLRNALKSGDIDPIKDFILDAIAGDQELEDRKGQTIKDITDKYIEDCYFHVASEFVACL